MVRSWDPPKKQYRMKVWMRIPSPCGDCYWVGETSQNTSHTLPSIMNEQCNTGFFLLCLQNGHLNKFPTPESSGHSWGLISPRKAKKNSHLLTKTATQGVDRDSLMFSLTFRLGVYPTEQGKQNPNMT